ncbi:MAG: hypothetical protein KatS3mg078_1706 [Deltaproteobacteria bacterium]|jgi:ubiquinone/menaquinone biosynthesis C-methylase UbiE|nr:MAG: hypothetical protein KatS3mg078_1706 [Deltaproteobacteria bacterium]
MQLSAHSHYPETADIETSSEDYARRFSGEVGAWFLKVQEEAVLNMLVQYPFARVLDVGGGHGQLTGPLIQKGYRVCVLGSAEVCKARIKGFLDRDQCEFVTGNILDIPFPDRAFDVVISLRLLPHVRSWRLLIKELTRVSKQAVIVDYPSKQSLNLIAPFLFRIKKSLEGNTRPYTLFRERELLEVFKLYGFTLAERYPEFFLPMVLHRIVNSKGFSLLSESVCRFIGLTRFLGSPVILKLVRKGEGHK